MPCDLHVQEYQSHLISETYPRLSVGGNLGLSESWQTAERQVNAQFEGVWLMVKVTKEPDSVMTALVILLHC